MSSIEQYIDQAYNAFSEISYTTKQELFEKILKLFDSDTYDSSLQKKFDDLKEICMHFHQQVDKNSDYPEKLNQIIEKIHHIENVNKIMQHLYSTMDTDYDTNSEHELNNIYEYIPLNYDDLKSHQKLFLILINIFYLKKYKKVNDIVYKEIYSGPHNTHAWEQYDTILSAVHNECTMTKSSTNWTLMTVTNNNDKNISHLLEKTHDPRFPTLYKQRSVFSFQNGIYFCLAKLSGLEASTNVVVIPNLGKVTFSKLNVPPYKLLEATI